MFAKNTIIPIVLIVISCLGAYSTIFDNEFVWDDHIFILDNPDTRSFANIPLFFTTDVDGLYRPLRSVLYTIMYSLFGTDAFWYHVHAVLWHIAVTILLYFIFKSLTRNQIIALLAAILFAVHPIHTERVTNMTASFDIAGIFFLLLAFWYYMLYRPAQNKKYLVASLLLFVVAVFFSEEAITFPALVVLYEFCYYRSEWLKKEQVKRYVVVAGLAVSYIFIRFSLLDIVGRQESYVGGTFFNTMLTMVTVLVKYVWLLIYPMNLSLFYDVRVVSTIADVPFFLSLLFLIGIILVIFQFYNKVVFFSVSWFFITLLPMMNIVPLQVFMTERYLYTASAGFCLLVAYFLFELFNTTISLEAGRVAKVAVVVLFVGLVGFYGYLAIERNADWQDNLTLWTKTVQTNPYNSRAHDNLGFTYEQRGEDEKALAAFETAVSLKGDNFRALANLGVAYAKMKRYDDAITMFERSLNVREYHKTYDKLGLVLIKLRREQEAIEAFENAISVKYRYPKAHSDLGTVLGRVGRFEEALAAFDTAIEIDRTFAEAHFNKGIVLEFLGENDAAQESFRAALSLEPGNAVYQKKVR